MALEYVRHGRTLGRTLAAVRESSGGRVPSDIVLGIFRQVLHALSAAHATGIVHRDMKPDNVLIAPVAGNPYFVKVLDFGLAKAVAEVSGFDGDISRSGLVLGTPYYMAPEQAPGLKGRPRPQVDHRADLYAVAVMVYEVFTGIRPFTGDSALAILTSKVDPDHRPLDFPEARALPGPLRDFLARGMAEDPAARFGDADTMLAALERAVQGRRLTAVGLTLPGSGSSQERPATPPSPPADRPVADGAGARPAGVPFEQEGPTMRVAIEEPPGETVVPRRGRPWWPYVAGPITGLGLVFGGYWLWSSGRESAPVEAVGTTATPTEVSTSNPPVPAPPPRSQPAAAAPEPVPVPAEPNPARPAPVTRSFRIETRPSGATVSVDGKAVGPSPVRYEVSSTDPDHDGRRFEIVASLKGYRSATRVVSLSEAVGSGAVLLDLQPIPRTPKPAPPPPSPRPGPRRL